MILDGNAFAIETHALARSFAGKPAIENLDLTVTAGEMFCLVGPDGAGKSTAIRLLCGILEPTGGEARVLGLDLAQEARAVRARVGYLSQEFTLYGDLTVDENIDFFARLHGVHQHRARGNELLEFTRLTEARGRLAGNLSGGMKKKLALACTLIHTPEIIFLDEPSTGVDPVSRGEFWNILSGVLDQGMTIIMTTPYLDEAERCDRVGLLHHGGLIATGRPDEVRATMPGAVYTIECPDIKAAYRSLRSQWDSVHLVLAQNRVRFWSPRGEVGASEARRLLETEGLGPVAMDSADPTLEDAFVALLSVREDGAAEGVRP